MEQALISSDSSRSSKAAPGLDELAAQGAHVHQGDRLGLPTGIDLFARGEVPLKARCRVGAKSPPVTVILSSRVRKVVWRQ